MLFTVPTSSYLYTILLLNLAFSIPIFGHYWRLALKSEPMSEYKKEKEISALIYLGATTLSVLVIGLSFLLFKNEFVIFNLKESIRHPIVFAIVSLILVDLFFYVYHRISHVTSLGWLFHSSHHAIETLAYENSVRIDLKDFNPIYWIAVAIPMGFLGFNSLETYVLLLTSLYYQYFLHSGANWFRNSAWGYVFNNPSLHRVHHSIHDHQLDKNFGGIISLYDFLFFTSCRETKNLRFGDFGLHGVENSSTLHGTYLSFSKAFFAVVKAKPWYVFVSPRILMREYNRLNAVSPMDENLPIAS
ncbi:MAG TPA: sterol desaturase family protein [Oligoflexus sp.]|uniref:sterol desaturase family protein n=1 Tax=Oligoflexus sp. TaxID=1971216 RepID=UPI002D5CCFBD|nr:sterol desaturase family protein [Oligoflexus sp.]HYX38085.1 sterol desaturase family protein [Oligoflexus sp.]